MPRILVTNDDGVHSEGIRELAAALAPLGDITTIAPLVFAVDGTPTDCVNIAITHVLRDKPDLIVSGINKGWNLGDDVTYSGTVSGALEGALLAIPSIAVSTQYVGDHFEFGPSATAAAIVAESVLERGMPKWILLNINTPMGPNKGFRITAQ